MCNESRLHDSTHVYAAFFAFDFFSSAVFTCSTIPLNAVSSVIARSERILRSRPMFGGFQTFGETAVGEALRADGGVQPLDPEIAESALARFAIAIGPIFGLHRRVFRVTEKFRTAAAITFGGFDDAFAALPAGGGVSGSWHFVLSHRGGTPLSANCSVVFLICPTSFADLTPRCRTRCADHHDALAPGGKNRRLTTNDKWFSWQRAGDQSPLWRQSAKR